MDLGSVRSKQKVFQDLHPKNGKVLIFVTASYFLSLNVGQNESFEGSNSR